jgi:hypothetical protein
MSGRRRSWQWIAQAADDLKTDGAQCLALPSTFGFVTVRISRLAIIGVSCCAWSTRGVVMLTRSNITLGMLASMLAAGNAFAVSKEAQEFMNIQSKMAPDQCELQRLSSQAAAAQRAGDLGKRQELNMQIEPVVKRLQANQPRIQELVKYIQAPSPDYQAVMQQTIDLRAKCKY